MVLAVVAAICQLPCVFDHHKAAAVQPNPVPIFLSIDKIR